MENIAGSRFRSFRFGAWLTVLTLGLVILLQAARAASFTVVNTDDSGSGSLRQMIIDANLTQSGTDLIFFDIPGAGPHTILLASPLPVLDSGIWFQNNDPDDEIVAVRRSAAIGTPSFRIFTINPGRTILIRGLNLTNGLVTSGGGGAIYNQGSLSMRDCTITLNSAPVGGAIYNVNESGQTDASLFMSHCILTENSATGSVEVPAAGGALFNYSFIGKAVSQLDDCVVSQNANDSSSGGGISNGTDGGGTATLLLNRCTFSDNSAFLHGGAINNYNNATSSGTAAAVLSRCTLEGNQSRGGGGAVSSSGTQDGCRLTLQNCTLSGNTAGTESNPSTGRGGGGAENQGANTLLVNCTFANNLANNNAVGASIFNTNNGRVVANNTIFRRTGAKDNIVTAGEFISNGHNLCNDAAGGNADTGPGGELDHPGDIRNTDPQLFALADNGGPTQTRALQADSPAIDAGRDETSPALDQRLYTRVGVSDIGAYEFGGAPTPTPTPPPTPTPIPTPTPTPGPSATPIPGTLANISTRLRVETGDNVLIGGFIITGTQAKKIIVRGIGTSLPFVDRLENPTLELRDSSGALLDSNDNWVDSPNKQAIIDSTIPPSNDLESAIVATVAANNSGYTAIVRGVEDGVGIGVVEAYDLDNSVDSKLANISTRGFVQTGDNVLIAGTIVAGESSQNVLVRAIGPSLPVPGKLEDPTLELRDGNGALLEGNDNWVDSPNKQAIIASTIPPANDLESAIMATLPANGASYTAIVRGVNDTTGIAVVEVYALQ